MASTLGLDSGQMLQDQAQGKAPVDTTTGIEMQNLDVHLNGTAPVTGCDPWLTNFQKILTDGDPQAKAADDPTQTETSQEVAYQSFVPNLVHVRGRVATGQLVTDLQPVRLAPDPTDPSKLDSQDTGLFQYTFLVPNGVDPNSVVVNAKMEFRNIPPYFVTQLAQDQRDVLAAGFNVPEDARIFDDKDHPFRTEDLLNHMAITEVGERQFAGRQGDPRLRQGPAERGRRHDPRL